MVVAANTVVEALGDAGIPPPDFHQPIFEGGRQPERRSWRAGRLYGLPTRSATITLNTRTSNQRGVWHSYNSLMPNQRC